MQLRTKSKKDMNTAVSTSLIRKRVKGEFWEWVLIQLHSNRWIVVFHLNLECEDFCYAILEEDPSQIVDAPLAKNDKRYEAFSLKSEALQVIINRLSYPSDNSMAELCEPFLKRAKDAYLLAKEKERRTEKSKSTLSHLAKVLEAKSGQSPSSAKTNVEEDYANLPDLAERIIWARKRSGKTQSEVSNLCGLTKGAISLIENKRNSLSGENVFPVADALGVNARWLLTGEGSPYATDENSIPLKVRQIAEHLAALPEERLNALSVVLGIKL